MLPLNNNEANLKEIAHAFGTHAFCPVFRWRHK